MHFWRCWLLRLFGAKIGASVKVYASARIWAPWNLSIEDGAILGDRVDCYCVAPISIGAGAVISQDSCLCAATHDHRSDAFTLIPKPIVIAARAWVAARAFIGPGVTVGRQSVIGACAVVFRDVPEGVTVVGNPATVINRG
jgi:putative colanic acid biosynthesis acetyltransferase WcaF